MKGLAIILNVFIPGVGSFVVGKPGQGIAQILLYALGIVLCFTVIGVIVGAPLCFGIWIWGIVTAASSGQQQQPQIIIQQNVTHGVASHTVSPNGVEYRNQPLAANRDASLLDATPRVTQTRTD
jgi:TM2 domain-containing membrane protein YozV